MQVKEELIKPKLLRAQFELNIFGDKLSTKHGGNPIYHFNLTNL